jgi:hypothetical protein
MCYLIAVSTSSGKDLTKLNSRFVRFSRAVADVPRASFLQFQNKWFLGSMDGCSCRFRHLEVEDMAQGFAQPADWFPEDADDIAATIEVVGAFKAIMADGSRLDCVDSWTSFPGEELELGGVQEIDLAGMAADRFRFIESYRLVFKADWERQSGPELPSA